MGLGGGTLDGWYSEKELTYLELKGVLENKYGEPEKIIDKKLGPVLLYNFNRIILIPNTLGVETSDDHNPSEINNLINKLKSFDSNDNDEFNYPNSFKPFIPSN